MNKVYRVVKSKSTGQWVAASEISTGQSKGKSVKKLLAASITGTLLAALPTVGWATCTGLGTNNVSCTGADSGVLVSQANDTNPVTVNATDWTLNAGRLHMTNAGGSSITFNGSNVTITNGVSTVPGLIHIGSSGAGDAIISVDGSSITGTVAATYGLVTHATGTGSASTSASDSTFTMNDGEALHAIAHGGTGGNATVTSAANTIIVNGVGTYNGASATAGNGTATVSLTGANNITMNNGGSALAATGRNVVVSVVGSNTVLKTTGTSGHGIKATASTGTATVTAAGTITTSGTTANGINSITNAGLNTVTNNATITTGGNQAHGINAKSTTGNIAITNNKQITANGTGSLAINAASDSGHITINNYADVSGSTSSTFISGVEHGVITAKITGGAGYINITSTAAITHSGQSRGIYAENHGSGGINVDFSGRITGTNDTNPMSHGILVDQKAAGAAPEGTGNATVTIQSGANIALGGKGVAALGYAGAGTTLIHNKGSLTVNAYTSAAPDPAGSGGSGIGMFAGNGTAKALNEGNIRIVGGGAEAMNIVAENGSAELINTSTGVIHTGDALGVSGATRGTNAYGMYIEAGSTAKNLYIENAGKITTEWKAADGINVAFPGTGTATSLNIVNSGTITTGDKAPATETGLGRGIYVVTPNSPVTIDNSGTITTHGTSQAIYVNGGKGSTTINNTGNITLNPQGIQGWGVNINQTTGNATININGGTITTYDSQSLNAGARDGNSLITTAAGSQLYSYKNPGSTRAATGPEVSARTNGTTATIIHNGYVEIGAGGSDGMIAWVPDNNRQVTARIEIGSTGIINAQKGKNGMDVQGDYKNNVDILAGGQVHGGSVAGVMIRSKANGSAPDSVVNNAGIIDAMSDKAIANIGYETITSTAGTLAINNNGTLTGYVSLSDENTTFTNNSSNSWNIRNFADTDGDGVRDTKAVAASDFGTGNDTLINTATGTIRLAAVNGAATTDTTGEYIPAGALSTSQSGIVQGQLLNLNRFENAGLIDMTANSLAGDVLVITGGTAAGTNGGGTYVSNGGSIKLDTVLNQGDTKSQSDILVVDNVTLGTGATKVFITPAAGSASEQTVGDGIKVIEVLGTQDANSFVLGAPVTYGEYEYLMDVGTAGNWYLTNKLVPPVGPGPATIINPNAGSYLGNQNAAANMFNINVSAARNHNRGLYDGSRPEQTLWFTANHNETRSDLFDGNQDLKIKTNLFQVGTDVLKREDYVLGVYGGFGTSSIENKSRQTGTRADGKVTGYHLGVYGSWAPEENKGPYVDAWGYYAWYQNKLKGAAQQYGEAKYDSTGYALAVQAGYGFEVLKQANGNTWVLEPHARLSYSDVDAESFYDKNNTRYSSNKGGGVQTQLGARFYGNLNLSNERTIKPYVELNWLHNASDNAINLNGVKMDSDIGKNVGEVKIGANAELTERLSLWGHVGAQRGSESFKRYEIEVGLGWKW